VLQGSQAAHKEAVLLALCSRNFTSGRVIVFTRTKQQAHRLRLLFGLAKLPQAGGAGVQVAGSLQGCCCRCREGAGRDWEGGVSSCRWRAGVCPLTLTRPPLPPASR